MRLFATVILFFATIFGASAQDQKFVKYNKEGKFKIVQFTDVHYTGEGPQSANALEVMRRVLDAERPDLVVFTGDIVVASDEANLWREVSSVVARRNIPFAITFGNHDSERRVNRAELYKIVEALPGCINGTDRKASKGDFTLLLAEAANQKPEAVLYFFDSNEYNAEDKSYAGISPTQVQWYERRSGELTKSNAGVPLNALAFFHVPLNEYTQAWENPEQKPVGLKLEACCPGRDNSGMFEAMKRCGDVSGVFVGHDHDNDYVACKDGIALAYGRFSGGNTYYDLARGARVIELSRNEKGFATWIRRENGSTAKKVLFPNDFMK